MDHNTSALLYICPNCGEKLQLDTDFSSGKTYFYCDDCKFTKELNNAQVLALASDIE